MSGRNRRVGPIAPNVEGERDALGPYCHDCGGTVYVDGISLAARSGRIGPGETAYTYRHVDLYPPCERLQRTKAVSA